MPLVSLTLQTEIEAFLDPDGQLISGDPAVNWSSAFGMYFLGAINPPPTMVSVAESAMLGALGGMDAPGAAGGILKAGAATFAGIVSATPPGLGIPPPAPLPIEAAFPVGMSGGDHKAMAATLAGIIDGWFRTGMYSIVPAGVPGFSLLPFS